MSNSEGNLQNVAFLRQDGKKVLIVLNDDNNMQQFNIRFKSQQVAARLDSGSVATYVW